VNLNGNSKSLHLALVGHEIGPKLQSLIGVKIINTNNSFQIEENSHV
jgi:hypothetical protein